MTPLGGIYLPYCKYMILGVPGGIGRKFNLLFFGRGRKVWTKSLGKSSRIRSLRF
jgi:hypothetical protein